MEIHDVFISYSSKDKAIADAVCHALEQNGLTCWIAPRDVRPGERYAAEIVNGIKNCRLMVLIYSKNSNQSEHVASEVDRAFNSGTIIIPFLVDDTPMNDEFDYYLARKHWLVAYPHYAEQLGKLAKAVAGVLNIELTPINDTEPKDTLSKGKEETDISGSLQADHYLKVKPDLDCVFYLDGEKTATLKAGKIKKLPLAEGEYELKFVSTENAEDKIVEDFRMPAYDKLYSVVLMSIRKKRLEQERITEVALQKAEQERLEQERIAAEQQAKKEAEKKTKAEARRKAKMEAEKKAKEEAERQVRLEEEKRAKEEAEKERIERARKDREQVFNVKGVEFKMLKVEGGSFWMGADNGKRTRTVTVKTGLFGLWEEQKQVENVDTTVKNYDSEAWDDEKPVHKVTLSSFYMGEVVVTQALWKAVMGSEPTENGGWESKYGKGDNYPAYRVSYNDIVNDFLPELNRLTGKNFRLPTEAEWEYAARGGRKSHGYKYSGSNTIGDVAWYWENSGDKKLSGSWDGDTIEKNNCKTHPVNCKKPNELGLYDMSGNVWEWCKDWKGSYSSSERTNPTGLSNGSYRVLRGGSWIYGARRCRVSNRYGDDPDFRYFSPGFRLCLPQ